MLFDGTMFSRRRFVEDKRWLIIFTLHAGKITRPAGSDRNICCTLFGRLSARITRTIETSRHGGSSDILKQSNPLGRAEKTFQVVDF